MSAEKYTATIGLEIHAELSTKTKVFSRSENNPDEETPNALIHPIDLGHPGTLPTINKKAVESVIRVGLAIGGKIAEFTEFDRKHYFYPDIPKGYQISQYKHPIVEGGSIEDVGITRIHLEEDTGTSKHDRGDFSLIDYNRAGVSLLELVTEPDMHSAEEAVAFATEFQLLLKYLGASEANMEKGEMRVEANISVSDDPKKLGTKVEVKNLNSFRAVEKAITYELKRMRSLLESGKGSEIVQETRGWDETSEKTFSQRKKETSEDYRYFPEPDLPKLYLHKIFNLEELKNNLPELPWTRRARYIDLGLSERESEVLVGDLALAVYLENCTKGLSDVHKRLAANYILSDILGLFRKEGGSLDRIPAKVIHEIVTMVESKEIGSRVAKDLLAWYWNNYGDENIISPREKVKAENLGQQSDEGALISIVDKIISENEKVASEFRSGKITALEFLVGQGMKVTKGAADPATLRKLIEDRLN